MRRDTPIAVLCSSAAMVCVPVRGCTGCDLPNIDDVWLYVRRRGKQDWLLKYPAWEHGDDGTVCFLLDDQFPTEHGRYEAEIRHGDVVLGVVELAVPRNMRVGLGEPLAVKAASWYAPPKPDGVTDMYQQIETFSAALCRILEKDDIILPISADKVQQLAGIALCRPAQLVITDGVHREIVEWRHDNGEIVIERAKGGTVPQRFPQGAIVRFEWTEDNVLNAMQGC